MGFALGEVPRGPNEAYDVLQNVFSGSEFEEDEAVDTLVEVMDMDISQARREVNTLRNMGAIIEA